MAETGSFVCTSSCTVSTSCAFRRTCPLISTRSKYFASSSCRRLAIIAALSILTLPFWSCKNSSATKILSSVALPNPLILAICPVSQACCRSVKLSMPDSRQSVPIFLTPRPLMRNISNTPGGVRASRSSRSVRWPVSTISRILLATDFPTPGNFTSSSTGRLARSAGDLSRLNAAEVKARVRKASCSWSSINRPVSSSRSTISELVIDKTGFTAQINHLIAKVKLTTPAQSLIRCANCDIRNGLTDKRYYLERWAAFVTLWWP